MSLQFAIVIASGVVVFLGWRFYRDVDNNTEERANVRVVPRVDGDSISELGVIFEARDEIKYSDRIHDVKWWVKVPETNKRGACSWDGGFRGFEENDGVIIIHKRGGPNESDWSGYIVGMHGKKKGVAAAVWALDVDDIQ